MSLVWWIRNQMTEFLCWVWDRPGDPVARRHARRFIRGVVDRMRRRA